MNKKGVLLINLGTPESKDLRDVHRYLTEFLTDGRVIDIPWLKRQLLVRGVIVPKRYKESARNYERIWTQEGSPLKVHSRKMQEKLQAALGAAYQVELAMRYQMPSIESVLEKLKGCLKITVIPLFPQYSSAATGSAMQKTMEVMSQWTTIPEVHFINSYPIQKEMIEAFCERAREQNFSHYDHVVFSFHGLPEKHVRKADLNNNCLKRAECCALLCEKNKSCYSAQCHATAQAIAGGLALAPKDFSICFQSRLGKDPWLKPYTLNTLKSLIHENKKRVLVLSPAFVSDCLETLDEIGYEYRKEFIEAGGEVLELVPALNDHPLWIEALKSLVLSA